MMRAVEVFDCRTVAERFFGWASEQAGRLPFVLRLHLILYKPAADPASLQYRDLVLKDARKLGVEATSAEAGSESELLELLRRANEDPGIHGVMVFYPLRSSLVDEDVMDMLSPYKDVEGLHSTNLGYLLKYKKFLDRGRDIRCVVPATPKAVVKLLQSRPELKLEGSFCVIVNNSMRVGKPLNMMLENLGATVVSCYHLTPPELLEHCVRRADLIVTAVPDPAFELDPSWVRPGAALIDVSHQGNFDVEALRGKAGWITTSDNRIGRLTRAMTFVNLIYCARYKGVYYD